MAKYTHTTSRRTLFAAPDPNAALIRICQQFAEPDYGAEANQDTEGDADDDGSWWTPATGPADRKPVRPAGAS